MATRTIDVFVKNPSTATAEIDGQIVALDIRAGICFGLDPIASNIWKLLEDRRSLEDICDALLRLYDVDRATCEEQTLALLHELVDIGLVSCA